MKNKDDMFSVRWHYDAGRGAIVWQLMFTETGDLVGQKRFPADRRALFFCIDTVTGKVFCDDYLLMDHVYSVPAGDGWFTGLETISKDLAYCYACQPQSPEHKGIWAIDFRADKVVWARSDIGFIANLDNAFLVSQSSVFGGFPEQKFLLVDPCTGMNLDQSVLGSAQVNVLRENVLQEKVRQNVVLPEVVAEEMAEERLALQQIGIPETIRCECIMKGVLMVAALHEQRELSGAWDSFLKVWHMNRLVYTDCMAKDIGHPCMNNFLIHGDDLFYIRNREELVCVALS